MMKSIKIYIIFAAIYVSMLKISNAQDRSVSNDSLFIYLEIAAKNNPTVLQKFSEYQAALQKVPQVGSLPNPEVSLGVFLRPMELISGSQVADIRLMQMFPWFGVLKNGKDEMSLMAKAKFESFRDAKFQVLYDVQRTWFDLYKVQQDISISEQNIGILHTLERLALIKFKAAPSGTGSSSSFGENSSNMGSQSGGSGLVDYYRIQIEIGELQNNIALLKDQLNTIIAKFNSYLNRPLTSTVFIPDTLEPDTLSISLLSGTDSLLTNNPLLGMLQYEQQSYEARKKMVTRMGYPMVGLGVNYSVINTSNMSTSSMNGKDMIMPMLTVTLPIYRKKYKAMQTEADFLKAATEQGYDATAISLQTEYYDALQLYQDAGRRIQLYENQSVLANKSLDIMIKSFSASGSGLTDVLQIRQQTLDYKFKQVEAVVDYNTAIAWLMRLMAYSQIQ